MKKYVLGVTLVFCTLLVGCTESNNRNVEEAFKKAEEAKDEITIMHEDADVPEFQKFIAEAEEKLNLTIHLLPCPDSPDNRQAKISTILSAGESSVDIFSVDDEMISEFKKKGYLEPLNDTVMTRELLEKYPESYMQNITMDKGNAYSVPYYMDIMVYWVNEEMLGDRQIESMEDFLNLVSEEFGENKYGYGSAWDNTCIYNELSQFIYLFGGDYYNWQDPGTRKALTFLHNMAENKQVSAEQVTDAYEQLTQKFIDGTYASVFMYSGFMNVLARTGVYKEGWIQAAPLPQFEEAATNIATWQYVLNSASLHKESAIRFLKYAAGREGSIAYAKMMNRLPARLDIIREEKLNIPGFDVLQDYIEHVQLKERPLSENAVKDITAMGELFQKYIRNEIDQDEFCASAQKITDEF